MRGLDLGPEQVRDVPSNGGMPDGKRAGEDVAGRMGQEATLRLGRLDEMVLDRIVDDFECVGSIAGEVIEECRAMQWVVTVADVEASLRRLVGAGLADAYDLGDGPPRRLAGDEEAGAYPTYYFVNAAGRRVLGELGALGRDG
jgi:hypothetical protein